VSSILRARSEGIEIVFSKIRVGLPHSLGITCLDTNASQVEQKNHDEDSAMIDTMEAIENLLTPSIESDDYRPVVLHMTNECDVDRMLHILRERGGIAIFDTLKSQLGDLIRTRYAHRKLTDVELAEQMDVHLGGVALTHYGAWVWYPWSRRLVHTLDASEFVELRTNRNHFKITPDEQARLASRKVGVVGLSVGHAVALTIALERSCGELRLADFDHLDLSNMNRVRCGLHQLNCSKAINTARDIAELDPYLQVTCFVEGLHRENYEAFFDENGQLDVVVDECDSLDVKCELRIEARRRQIPVVMATSDRGMVDIERFDLERDRLPFHGLLGNLDSRSMQGLTTEEKIPFVLEILGERTLSPRLRASFVEIDQQIKTWPQLGSAVGHGAGAVAEVVRRLGLGELVSSGRYFDDLDLILANPAKLEPDCSRDSNSQRARPQLNHQGEAAHATEMTSASKQTIASLVQDDPSIDLHGVRQLVYDATLAPSPGNTQPWKWTWEFPVLTLHRDLDRGMDSLDFRDGATIASLGAATENLVLSAKEHYREPGIAVFPHGESSPVVAKFDFSVNSHHRAESAWRPELYGYLSLRHTNRRLETRQAIPRTSLEKLNAAVESISGARLQVLSEQSELDEIGTLVGMADRLRMLNRTFHGDLVRELRWTEREAVATRDGVDVRSLYLKPSDQAGLRIGSDPETMALVKSYRGGRNLEKMSCSAIKSASAVGLITMPSFSSLDYFQGGRALQRCWLTATELEIAFWPMTCLPYFFAHLLRSDGDIFDVDERHELRQMRQHYEELFELSDDDGEILLFRMGVAPAADIRSLRRELDDVLTVRN
jgi:molybdopterin/thiamine biosynthesis adenylyltransferase